MYAHTDIFEKSCEQIIQSLLQKKKPSRNVVKYKVHFDCKIAYLFCFKQSIKQLHVWGDKKNFSTLATNGYLKHRSEFKNLNMKKKLEILLILEILDECF